jgi:hypothetical protein
MSTYLVCRDAADEIGGEPIAVKVTAIVLNQI